MKNKVIAVVAVVVIVIVLVLVLKGSSHTTSGPAGAQPVPETAIKDLYEKMPKDQWDKLPADQRKAVQEYAKTHGG